MISQSIMWAAAILMVAILDDTNFEILLLVVLATISILKLNNFTLLWKLIRSNYYLINLKLL